jgi:adenosylcobinamide-GDP ribazoletransferase
MIASELRLFLVALQFLTRIPVRSFDGFQPEWLDRSAKYFPLVGAVVGASAAAVIIATTAIFPQPLPMVFGLATAIAVTGAFHEDGLADTADGLGGGLTPDSRLDIMKDSRIGTYGAVALITMFAMKASAMIALGPIVMALALIPAHATARLATVFAIRLMTYAGDAGAAKVKPLATGLNNRELVVAVALGLVPGLLLLNPVTFAAGLIAGSLAAALVAYQARRLIGGYTGDILGAIEQVFEAAFLVAAAAVVAGPG